MDIKIIIIILGILGICVWILIFVIIVSVRQFIAFPRKKNFKETRYLYIVSLFHVYLDFEKNKCMLHQYGRPDIETIEDLNSELVKEMNNMILFASNEVLSNMESFIENPSQKTFHKTATAMQLDMWE